MTRSSRPGPDQPPNPAIGDPAPTPDPTRDPWTRLEQRAIYRNPWIAVTEHQVLTPGGKPGIYGTVQFQHLAIGILPIDPDGHTWLVGQYRFPLQSYSWELPEGGGKLDQPPLDSARRELAEECSLAAGQWQEVLRLHLSNSVSDELAIGYIAWELSETAGQPDDTECLCLRRVPFAEAFEMAMQGAITDALSVALIQRARLMADAGQLPEVLTRHLARSAG